MRISAEQAAGELSGKNNILILSHASPDGDTLGCAFSLWNALHALGKRARVLCPDPLPRQFSFLYEGYTEEAFREEYIVAVDVAALQLLGQYRETYAERIDLCIDHHPSNGLYAVKTCLVPEAAACCEILAGIIPLMGAQITPLIASCLYTGVSTDTGCFKFSNTTANTHRTAARLIECGADFRPINERLFDTKSRARVQIEREALSSMRFYAEDRIALIAISQAMAAMAEESDLDGISSLPRMIEGVEIGITLREKPDGTVKASVRTTSTADASNLCARFGGGGHARAAGCTLNADLETAAKMLVGAAEELL